MSWLGNIFDSIFAPAGTDDVIDAHASTPMYGEDGVSCGSGLSAGDGAGTGPDWHNNWDTSADFQVPAESGNETHSWDWSYDQGGGLGDD